MLLRDFEVRDVAVRGDGRTVILACVPFDVPAMVDDGDGPYREVFRRGAFTGIRRASGSVELRYAHRDDGPPYGLGLDLEETATALVGSFRVAPSAAGDQLLALVRDDQLRGVSIGYVAGTSAGDNVELVDGRGRLVERMRVKRLAEVSLTPAPAYDGARVLAVREHPDPADLRASAAAVERELHRLRQRRVTLRYHSR